MPTVSLMADDRLRELAKAGVTRVRVHYADLIGTTRAKVIPLDTSRAAIEKGIDAMEARGNTNLPEGLMWGWRVVSPELPYIEGKAFNDKAWRKVIVFMTDGDNNATSSDTNTRTECSDAKTKDNIKIYSIAFMAPTRGQQLLQDCSSGTGFYFKAESMSDLLSAFQKIGQDASANKTLLTQ